MKLINKENFQKKILLTVDWKNFKDFFKKVDVLCKEAEYKSNSKKLNYNIVINSIRVPYMACRGVTSRVIDKNGRITHIGMFDWDNILESLLKDEVRYLFSLIKSPIYIFKSKENKDNNGQLYGNYMGITLVKRPFYDWIGINKQLHTDIAHSIVANKYRYKCFVLRMSSKKLKPKPQFKYVEDGGYYNGFAGEISGGHKQFLEMYYPIIKKINEMYELKSDGHKLSNVYFTEYSTASE